MTAYWVLWLVAAGIVVICELFTGTFYLLMISIGLAAGALVAFAGFDIEWQFIFAAIVGAATTYSLRRSRFGKFHRVDASRDPNVNLDIGQIVHINEWSRNDDGPATTRVMYRGAMWDVELAHGSVAQPGSFIIREIRASRLIVANHHSSN